MQKTLTNEPFQMMHRIDLSQRSSPRGHTGEGDEVNKVTHAKRTNDNFVMFQQAMFQMEAVNHYSLAVDERR